MIDQLADFTIVKGQNQASGKWWGDLQRITFPQTLELARPKGASRVPYGIDLAWLQECCAQREWTLGRDVNKLSTFSVVPSPEPMEAIYSCISSYALSGGDCFLTQTPSVTCIWDIQLSDWTDASESADWKPWQFTLERWCIKQGLQFELSSLESAQPLSVPPCNSFPSYWRYGSLESLMEQLGYAVPRGQASLTGYVTTDISAGDWDTYGEYIGHVTGTRSLLDTANIAHTADSKSWTTVSQSSTATSEHTLIPVLGTYCPRQRFSTTLVPQQVQLWARLQVRYESSGTKSTYSGVSKNVYCLMKIASISTYGVAGISRSMVDMMVQQVKARIDFDMDPANFKHKSDGGQVKTTEWAKFTVTMLGIDLLMQYKDTVTSPV